MIKKRNLDASLIQWIMTQTGLGPGIGELFYVAPEASATSQFRTQLQTMGVKDESIYTLPSLAYADMVASRNDVMLVAPGAYAETAEIAWSKAFCHALGLGGNNSQAGDYSEASVAIYTATANVGSVLTVTGAYSQFHNMAVENNYSDADNLTAVTINTYGTSWKNVGFHGHMAATQNTTAAAASLYIAGGGMYPLIEDCQIGQDVWGTRSGANSGVMRFTGTGRPNGATIRNCKFLSRSVTATCSIIAIPAATGIGRSWFFDNCHFSNFYDGTTTLTQVVYSVTGTQMWTIQLHNCSAVGYTEWQTGDFDVVASDMPITGTAGGLMKSPTGTVGT